MVKKKKGTSLFSWKGLRKGLKDINRNMKRNYGSGTKKHRRLY